MPGSAAVIVDDRQFRPLVWRFIAARSFLSRRWPARVSATR